MKSTSPSSAWRRLLCRALLVVGILLLLYIAYCGWRTYQHFSDLREHVSSLKTLDSSSLDSLALRLAQIQQDVTLLRRDLSLPLALAPHLGWLPIVGPTVQSGPTLFSAGESLLVAAVTAWDVVQEPISAALSEDADLEVAMAALSERAITRADQLEDTVASGQRALTLVNSIDTDQLLPRLSGPLSRIQALSPLFMAALDGLTLLPQLAGQADEQTYLLLAQNNDELRPTGGFISSMGTLVVEQGVPHLTSFEDSYRVENWEKPHPDPPKALREYMGLDLWVTRDGNWWPDFPTSAKAVAQLYELNRDRSVDGVMAIDMFGASKLIEALTPLKLPQGQRLGRDDDVMEAFRESWSLPPGSLVTSGIIVTATQPFSGIELTLSYSNKTGKAWFDTVDVEHLQNPGVNLVRNPSFEDDTNQDGLPDAWQTLGLSAQDRLVTEQAHSGQRSLLIVGDPETDKAIVQHLVLSGRKGDSFRVSAQSRSEGTGTGGGPYALTLTFLYDRGKPKSMKATFPNLTHDWATAGTGVAVGRWWRHRKDFMNQALQAAMQKMLLKPSSVRWLDLLTAIVELLDQRHIQLYTADSSVQALLERYGWSGALAETEGDYLLLVDSNLGYNKVSVNIDQTLTYNIVIDDFGRVRSRLSILYDNRSTGERECNKFDQYVPTYETMTQGCYWDYVRVYVPSGAELIFATGGDEPVVVFSELGRTVFAAYFVLPPGEGRELVFEYSLPSDVLHEDRYDLTVQKQAGTGALPIMIAITGPEDLTPVEGGLQPDELSTSGAVYRTDLLVDRHLTVRFPSVRTWPVAK